MDIQDNFEIYIMTRDRVNFLIENLEVIKKYNNLKIRVTISDNSASQATGEIVSKNFSEFNYIKRNNLSSEDHFNIIYSEVKSKYVLIFHDDDLLLPQFFDRIESILEKMRNYQISALAFNAIIIDENGKEKNLYNQLIKNNVQITTKKALVESYVDSLSGSAPFPSYIYNSQVLKKLKFNDEGAGKYSDVVLLTKILDFGEIYQLHEALMKYRIHSSNDSRDISVKSLEKMCEYLKKITPELELKIEDYYQMSILMYNFKNTNISAFLRGVIFYLINVNLIFRRTYSKLKRNYN